MAEKYPDQADAIRSAYSPEEAPKDPRVDEVKAELAALKRDRFRAESALEFKLPAEALDLVTGDTPEEIRASAEKLSKLISKDGEKKTPPKGDQDDPFQSKLVVDWEVPEPGAENDPLAEGLARQKKLRESMGLTN